MVTHLHQEPFQAATLEDCGLSELYSPGTVTTSGWLKRWVEFLHTGAVSIDILFLLHNCTTFLNFVEGDAELFFSPCKIKHFLTCYLNLLLVTGCCWSFLTPRLSSMIRHKVLRHDLVIIWLCKLFAGRRAQNVVLRIGLALKPIEKNNKYATFIGSLQVPVYAVLLCLSPINANSCLDR